MNCPVCHAPDSAVIDTRLLATGDRIRRRRKCRACDERWTTIEMTMTDEQRAENSRKRARTNRLKKIMQMV